MNFLNYSKDIMSLIQQGEQEAEEEIETEKVELFNIPKLDIPEEELKQLGKIGVLAEDLEGAENDSEDEGIEDYKEGGYHPVFVGECLIGRYVILQKLGWGHFSTVWMCRDLKYNTFVAIKIQKSASHYLEAAFDEVEILQKAVKHSQTKEWYEDLSKMDNGKKKEYNKDDCYTVQLLNAFIYQGPYGKHFCMVFEILGVNLLEIIKRYKYKGIPIHICRKMARQMLIGLHYLHKHCGIIHTDLKPENVMLCLNEDELTDIIKHKQLYRNEESIKRLEKLRAKIQGKPIVEKIKEEEVENQEIVELKVLEEKQKISIEIKKEEEIDNKEEKEKKVEKVENKEINSEKDSLSQTTVDTENKDSIKTENLANEKMEKIKQEKRFSELEDQTDTKNLNFSKKEDASRVIEGNEIITEKEENQKKELIEKKESIEIEKSETQDSSTSSQISGSLRDIVDLLILTPEDMNKEINRLMIEEPPKNKEENKRLKKRVKRKMKRHQKRWNKMTESEKQKYQLARDSLELRLQHRKNSKLSDDPNVQMEISKTSNDPPKVEDELAVVESSPQILDIKEVKYNEDAFDMKTGLKPGFKLKIADLGNGCWTHYHFQPEIQTRQYRGPEVILGINYNETADLWSLACMLFEMLTGDFLFDPKKSGDFKKNDDHLAQMLELLNEFPKNWSTIGTNSKRYFDKDGKLKKIKKLRFWGLKDILIQRYKMAENEAICLEDFLLPMLKVLPQERATAEEMLNHPWLSMKSKDFRNKDPTVVISNDEERFHKIINETDIYAEVSRSDCEEDEDDDDDDFVIEGEFN